jgi:hypothetical protein
VDCARHRQRLQCNPAPPSALADPRRFGKWAVTTIMSAEIAAWVGDGRATSRQISTTQQATDLMRLLRAPIPGIPGIKKIKSKQGLGTHVAMEPVYARAMWSVRGSIWR